MNIQVQLCGVAILILLLYFILRQKAVGLFSERVFLEILIVNLACVCLDILSIVAIVNHEQLPDMLVIVVCKAYIISLVWVGFYGLSYSILNIDDSTRYRKRVGYLSILMLFGSLLIAVLPIHYYTEGRVVYTYGPSVMMTYFFALGFVLTTLIIVSINKAGMSLKRRKAVLTWMLIWIIAAAIQFLNNQLLLVGFASCVGMMILFFELENPEAKMDRETGAYNVHELLEFMKQEYANKTPFSLLMISMDAGQRRSEREQDTSELFKEMVQYLERLPKVKVFKNVEREIILMFPDAPSMFQTFSQIQQRYQKPWDIYYPDGSKRELLIDPLFLLMPDNTVVDRAEDVFPLLRFFKMEHGNTSEGSTICYIDRGMAEQMRERERMEQTIMAAIENDRVEVFYQPIYSTKEKKFVSAEALVRIRNTDGSIIPPGMFIEVAEETGLIGRLGEIVFEKTCRFLKEYKLWELGIEYIEVNLSVRQCEKHNLADTYMNIIRQNDLHPSRINLEITETASIQTKKILLENMNVLIDFGIHFSLDDFGSGESNLNYIVDMPVSIVKFDRDMSQAYFENQKAKFVMEAAMRMIHDMKLKIVSEGVETKEQMEKITELGIEYIQGYYFSKPLPMDEFLEFIRRENAIG